MKKIIRLITVAASTALALTACSKNEALAPEAAKTVHVRVSGAPEAAEAVDPLTKTFISETGTNQYSVKWDNKGEALGIVLGELTDKSKPSTLTAEETEDNDPIFEGDVTAADGATKAFLFYPASAYAKSYAGSVGLELKATQNPILGSYDPACDLLVWATDAAKVEDESLVLENLTLQRPMALLRVNLNATGKAKENGGVLRFKMALPSDSKLTLTGRVQFDATGAVKGWTVSNAYVEAAIDEEELIAVGESDGANSVWLVVNPVTIPAGTDIEFTVETVQYHGANAIKRTVKAPSDMALEAGKVNIIDLTLRDKDVPGELVNDDFSGQWLIAGGTYNAAKKYESGNNLKAAAFTLNAEDNTITSTDAGFADCLMTFTKVTTGEYSGLYTIQDAGGKYLYAASPSSNHLKGKAEPDANAYWEVTKEGESYSIVATKSSNRNVMRYNPNSGSPLFSCYADASQSPVTLYPWSMVRGISSDPVISFDKTEQSVAASETSVLFTYTKNAFVTEEPTVSVTSGADCLDGEIIVLDGTITVPIKANTETVEKTIVLSVTGQGITGAVSLTITQEAFVPVTATTVAEILAAGEGTYDLVENLLVYAVAGSNAIVGDATGKILLYKSGMTAGDIISISGAVVTDFNGILEIHGNNTTNAGGTFTTVSQGNTVNNGTPIDLDDASAASAVETTFKSTGYHSAAYVKMTGAQSGKSISGSLTLYLNAANTTYDGKNVTVEGYIYSYASKFSNYNFHLVSIAEANPKPSLVVDPEALSWNADEYGSAKAKTATVTLNAGATGYTVTGSSSDWTVSDNGQGVITVYPNAANTSESAAKTLTLTIVHKDDATLTRDLVLTQAKVGDGTLTIDFEQAASAYTDWTITNITTQQNTISAHGGSYYGNTNGKSTGSIVTVSKIASPQSVTFYISKESNNTTASNWIVEVSANGSDWTTVGDQQSASSGITKGTWTEVSRDLSSYSDVYVQIRYAGTTAVRTIDDVTLSYK